MMISCANKLFVIQSILNKNHKSSASLIWTQDCQLPYGFLISSIKDKILETLFMCLIYTFYSF